jgi:hypothetical protein
MTTAVQHRRGTTAEHSTFTGLEGEVTIDTTKDTAVIHDGVLAGGVPLARENLANVTPSGLATITGASTASDDKFFIYDQSATTLKSITRAELNNAMEIDALANVTITGGTINGTTIGNTTAAAGTFTSITNTGGTANGVTYLNGSKVLTSGSALTFDGTNFGVGVTSPSQKLELAGVLRVKNGNADTNGLNLSSDAAGVSTINSGYAGVGQIVFQTEGTERMRLTSTSLYTASGINVGIGTSAPGSFDSFANNLVVGTGSGSEGITIYGGSTDSSNLSFADGTGAASYQGFIQYSHATDSLAFYVNYSGSSSSRLTIDSSGNLGLGVAPSAWNAGGKIIEVGSAGNILFGTASATGLTQNASYISGWKYQATGAATYYEQYAGSHIWNNAPSWDGTGDNTIAFNQAMTLTADGRLGIGTPSPANMLDVRGTNPIIRVEPHVSTDAASFQAINDSKISYFGRENSLGSYFFSTNVTPYSTVLNAYGSTAPIIFGHNTPEVYILNGGNVGIGTSSPTSISGYTALEVNGNASGSIIDLAQGDVMRGRLVAVTGSFALETSGSIPILFAPGGSERMRITSAGDVGIGTTTVGGMGPQTGLTVIGGATVSSGDPGILTLGAHLNARSVGDPIGKIDFYSNDASGGASGVQASIRGITEGSLGESAGLAFHTGTSSSLPERMRIDSSGNLLVGTTSAGGTGTFRGVTICGGLTGSLGASYDYVGALYKYDSVNENGLGFWNTRGGASPAGGAVLKFYVGTSFTTVGNISTSASSTSYNTSSDYRLKENVVGVTGASARVQQLNPVRFNFIADLNKTVDGFLAHEVQNVVPEAITGTKDEVETYTDDEGNEQTRPVYQGIDQSKLVPLLTAALQEALAEINSLKARLDAANL